LYIYLEITGICLATLNIISFMLYSVHHRPDNNEEY